MILHRVNLEFLKEMLHSRREVQFLVNMNFSQHDCVLDEFCKTAKDENMALGVFHFRFTGQERYSEEEKICVEKRGMFILYRIALKHSTRAPAIADVVDMASRERLSHTYVHTYHATSNQTCVTFYAQ
jgi:hypothetical protein